MFFHFCAKNVFEFCQNNFFTRLYLSIFIARGPQQNYQNGLAYCASPNQNISLWKFLLLFFFYDALLTLQIFLSQYGIQINKFGLVFSHSIFLCIFCIFLSTCSFVPITVMYVYVLYCSTCESLCFIFAILLL